MPDIIPGAEPFFYRGGPIGALLIHGFTGAPKEMRLLAEALAAEGLTVLGVRLTHHGTTPDDMFRSHWRDWFTSALDGYYLLRDQCRQIFVMGLSMGGTLALRLSAFYPVDGVVAMSTPSQPLYDHMDWRVKYAETLSYLFPYAPKGEAAPTDPVTHAAHVSYPSYPVRAIPQLRELLHDTAALFPQITVPVLLAHSWNDQGVPPENMLYIFEHLGATDKEMFWLERSAHVITEEAERDQLFARIIAFVHAHPVRETE
ncbi:MAG TPA: alpha/beta fold hydrolase [Anaerolineales bacterium]|nr:alpha/beta fold hydrolase [Anaerolineales bacterium]